MAAAKFSEEVFAAITKGITEKVLSEIDNLRDRLDAASSPPDARRNDDMIARTSSVVADVLSLKRLVEKLEVRVATVEAGCRTLLPLLPGIIKNDQADTTPFRHPPLSAMPTHHAPSPSPDVANQVATAEAPPERTRANSKNHPSFKLHNDVRSIATGKKSGDPLPLLKEINERMSKNAAPSSLRKAVVRAVERLPEGGSGLGPSSRKLIGTPSFIAITIMLTRYYMQHNSEIVDLEDFINHVRSRPGPHGIGTVWSMLSTLTALGVISASDRQYVSRKHGGPAITGHLIMDQRFVEDALALSKEAAE